jgi:tetratricopeptide (TPR) repeat protein
LTGYLGVAGSELDRNVSLSTRSLPALKLYLEAARAWRANAARETRDALERAVEIDPSFALGWYRLSFARRAVFDFEASVRAAERALELSHLLSELDQLRVQAIHAVAMGEPEKAEPLYRTILGIDPDDVDALVQLAYALYHTNWRHARPLDEAQKPCERALALDPENIDCLWIHSIVALKQGRWEKAQSMIDRTPPEALDAYLRILPVFALGDSTAKDELMAELERGDEFSLCGALNALPNLSIEEAFRLNPLLTSPTRSRDTRTVGYIGRAYLEVAKGRWSLAKEAFAEAERLNAVLGLSTVPLLPSTLS